MVRHLSAWGAALVVWLVGFTVVAQLTPRLEPGERLAEFDRITRLDLPWIAICVLMVLVAGAVCRDRTASSRWLLGLLPVPILATFAGAAAGLGGQTGVVDALVYVVEGAIGAALGLLVAYSISTTTDSGSGYW